MSLPLFQMKFPMFLTFAVLTTSSAFADELLFEDNFNRKEADDSKEQVGDGWWTNSKRRAKGIKQIDLKNKALTITTAKEADHAAVVKHDAPFDDGKASVRSRTSKTSRVLTGLLAWQRPWPLFGSEHRSKMLGTPCSCSCRWPLEWRRVQVSCSWLWLLRC